MFDIFQYILLYFNILQIYFSNIFLIILGGPGAQGPGPGPKKIAPPVRPSDFSMYYISKEIYYMGLNSGNNYGIELWN